MKKGSISKAFIDDLIDGTDISDLIDQYVPLKKAGKSFTACCPFHSEKTPSFTTNSEKGYYYCFGCGAHGNSLNFLMEFSKIEFTDAIEKLASYAGVDVKYEVTNEKFKNDEKDKNTLLLKLNTFFQEQKEKHNVSAGKVEQFLELNNSKLTEINEVGFIPNPTKTIEFIKEGGIWNLAKKYKVINKYDKLISFSNALTYPVINNKTLQGFVVLNSKGKQLTIPNNLVFNEKSSLIGVAEAKRNENELPIYVVSSLAEKLKLEDMGLRNVICNVYRESPLTRSQYKHITSKSQKDIFFVFENTEESKNTVSLLVKSFVAGWNPNQSSQIKILFVPTKETLSTIIKKVSIDKLEYLHSKAIDLPNYFLSSLGDKVAEGNASELLVYIAPVLLLSPEPCRHLHDVLLDKAVDMFRVDRDEFLKLYVDYLLNNKPYHWYLEQKNNKTIPERFSNNKDFDVSHYVYNEKKENQLIVSAIYQVVCAGGLSNQDIKILNNFIPFKKTECALLSALSGIDLSDNSINIPSYLAEKAPDVIKMIKNEESSSAYRPIYKEHVVDELLVLSFNHVKEYLRNKNNQPKPN